MDSAEFTLRLAHASVQAERKIAALDTETAKPANLQMTPGDV